MDLCVQGKYLVSSGPKGLLCSSHHIHTQGRKEMKGPVDREGFALVKLFPCEEKVSLHFIQGIS